MWAELTGQAVRGAFWCPRVLTGTNSDNGAHSFVCWPCQTAAGFCFQEAEAEAERLSRELEDFDKLLAARERERRMEQWRKDRTT